MTVSHSLGFFKQLYLFSQNARFLKINALSLFSHNVASDGRTELYLGLNDAHESPLSRSIKIKAVRRIFR